MLNMIKNSIIILLIIVTLLFGMAGAQLPSDLIVKQDAPTKLDLSNTAPSSAIKTFINGSEELPANVGYLNATANVTKIEELNGSLVFW